MIRGLWRAPIEHSLNEACQSYIAVSFGMSRTVRLLLDSSCSFRMIRTVRLLLDSIAVGLNYNYAMRNR